MNNMVINSSKKNESSPTERAFEILEILAHQPYINISDVINVINVPKTSAHRLVNNLESFGFLESNIEQGKYQASSKLIELALGILANSIYNSPVHSILTELARKTEETCSIGIIRDSNVIYIDSAVSKSPLTLNFEKGHRAPLHCTSSGRIFLANMPDNLLNAYLLSGPWEQITPNTIVDPFHLKQEILKVREHNYAVNDSEFIVGVVGAAVPIYNTQKEVVACLSISAPRVRKKTSDMLDLITLLEVTSEKISKALFENS